MQQSAAHLKVHHIVEANNMLKELKDMEPMIRFRKVEHPVRKMEIWNYSDASFIITAGRDYEPTGIIIASMIEDGK